MRFVRTFLTWLRTRKRAATALTFEALLKRATEMQAVATHDARRPGYLPDPHAAHRIGLAVMGGMFGYAAVGTAVAGYGWGGLWWCATLAIPVLLALWNYCRRQLERSLDEYYIGSARDVIELVAALRPIFWPVTEPFCVLVSWIGGYTFHGLDRAVTWWQRRRVSRSGAPLTRSDTRSDAIRRIPELIVAIISEERERLFGKKSPFVGLRKRIETELEEARRLHAYFTRRAEDAGTAERRTTAIDRAASVRNQLDDERARLDEWRARVDAELGAYRDRVQGLAPEIDELVHYRALSRLEQSTAQLAAEVEAIIAEMTTDLLARVHGRCRELSGALHDASARVAVAAADTKDADRDVRIITDTVRELVRRAPTYDAKAVQEELRRPTRTAVHG